ncbi:MAG TPA: N-acyl homoserine lactonase family protein [Xanthobacteraceae bacterium]|nr:N-acyl homoserine lactonase family protein [Xanthobacteraceae bacterium]
MRIHAIQTGRVLIKRAQIEGRGYGLWRQLQPMLSRQWADWSPTFAWAIEHREGVIVVDTGAAAHLKSLPRWHPFFRFAVRFDIEPEQEIGPQLKSRGIGPRDVKTVVLTHLHIDHDGGLAHFPHSRILADAGEIKRAAGISGVINGYLPKRWPKWFDPQPLVWQSSPCGPFTQSTPLTDAGDVIAVPTPGHTPGHVAVIVRGEEEQVLLAGDASYLESTMLRGAIDGVSPNEGEAKRTLARMRAWCSLHRTVYLPTHDPQSGARLNQRRATVVRNPGQTRSATNCPPSATIVAPVI